MELAYNILGDILHLGKIIVVCNLIFELFKRKNKQRYLSAIIISGIYDILEINYKFLTLFTTLLTITFLLIIGNLVKKKNTRGIRTVKLTHLLFFTVLTLLDTFMMMALANRGIEGVTKEVKQIYGITYIFVVIGIFIQLGAVILLIVSRDNQKEKTEIVEKFLDE